VRRGVAEALVEADESIDVVWCRDVLEVLPDLDGAVAEMARVLRQDGCLIVYTNFVADQTTPSDLDRIHLPLGNLSRPRVAATLTRHGLEIVEEVTVGTGWREFLEERDQVTSRDLLRLARLRRRRDEIVTEYGSEAFATAEASLQWSVQQFLGNLVPTIMVVRKIQA
jgi:SAM-dependent methyltransferase